jgi:sialic acid synthase SpsE
VNTTDATIRIGRHTVGANQPVFVIAEIGATHGGDVERALKMIDVARDVGAQAVKLQTVDPDFSYRKGTPSYEIFQTLKLPEEGLHRMKRAADAAGLILFTTPGDFPSFEQAVRLDLGLLKISSGLMTNKPLVEAVARTGKPMIISSGMAYLDEIARSVRFARDAGARDLAVLHCTSSYPCPDDLVNLAAIRSMTQALGVPVGYSDHTHDELACAASVAAGAVILEKHMALSQELAGPETGTACDPAQFKRMVDMVRRVEAMRGNGIKAPAEREQEGRVLNRRRIMALTPIKKGTVIGREHIGLMRGKIEDTGLSPELYEDVLGKVAARDIEDNEPIRLGMIVDR